MTKSTWNGASGKTYTYNVYPIDTAFKDVGGNYIFSKHNPSRGTYTALYIGQTSSLQDRLTSSHHKWDCALKAGMTHLQTHQQSSESGRIAEEKDLLENRKPECQG